MVYEIIAYYSIFIWVLPLYKQYKGSFFFYFFLISISDPATLGLHNLGIYTDETYLVIDFLILILIDYFVPIFKFSKLKTIIFFILTLFGYLYFRNNDLLSILIHFLIFIQLLRINLFNLIEKNFFNLFYIILAVYEILLLLNMTFIHFSSVQSVFYFYFSILFMSLFAIFFIFFNDKSEKIIFYRKNIRLNE